MKFIVNPKKFIEAVKPIMSIAGRSKRKFDFDKICSEVTSEKENNLFDFSLITIHALRNEIIVSAKQNNITISVNIKNEKLSQVEYTCEEEGWITIESGYFWDILYYYEKLGRVVIDSVHCCKGIATLESDQGYLLEFPIFKFPVCQPEQQAKTKRSITINRTLLLRALKKVSFAVGDKNCKPQYQYLVLSLTKNRMRFVAGNGSRFAIYEITAEGIPDYNKCNTILFPRQSVGPVLKALSQIRATEITLQYGTSNKSGQIFIQEGDCSLTIDRIDRSIKYPSMYSVLNGTYAYKAHTKKTNWRYCVHDLKHDIPAQVTADFVNGCLIVKHGIRLRSQTPIPIIYESSIPYVDPELLKDASKLKFNCNGLYLDEMLRAASNNDVFAIEFGEKTAHSKIRSNAASNIESVFVSYPKRVRAKTGATEQFYMSFVQIPQDKTGGPL